MNSQTAWQNHWRLRILVVEDSEDILFIMKTELEWLGYDVDVAPDGERGLELARIAPPDVVVSDIQMPGMDGFEFVRRIHEMPGLANVPAIALTGFAIRRGEKQGPGLGFTAHLIKPVDPAELSDLVETLTQRKRWTKAS